MNAVTIYAEDHVADWANTTNERLAVRFRTTGKSLRSGFRRRRLEQKQGDLRKHNSSTALRSGAEENVALGT